MNLLEQINFPDMEDTMNFFKGALYADLNFHEMDIFDSNGHF